MSEYFCEACNYRTNVKSSYKVHLKSKKHAKNSPPPPENEVLEASSSQPAQEETPEAAIERILATFTAEDREKYTAMINKLDEPGKTHYERLNDVAHVHFDLVADCIADAIEDLLKIDPNMPKKVLAHAVLHISFPMFIKFLGYLNDMGAFA